MLPPDTVLWYFPRHKTHLLSGYSKRRRIALRELMKSLQERSGMKATESLLPTKSRARMTSNPSRFKFSMHSRRSDAQTLVSAATRGDVDTMSPPDTAVDLLDEDLVRSFKAGDSSSLLPVPGELCFPEDAAELVFKPDHLQQKVVLANKSSSTTYWFWIQVCATPTTQGVCATDTCARLFLIPMQASPPALFTAVPGFGWLRPDAEMDITVSFEHGASSALKIKVGLPSMLCCW